MNTNLEAVSKRFAGATVLFAKKHGPAILTGCGVAGFIATNVLVARAVLKAQEPISKFKAHRDNFLHTEDEEKQLAAFDMRTDVIIITKAFAPAISVGAVSLACFLASYRMMHSRQVALVAAYTAVKESYDAYRRRVIEQLGEDKERELYREVKTLVNPDDPTLPCEIDYGDVNPSPYSRVFGQLNPNWNPNPEYNMFFLTQQQMWANDRLNAYGYLFLNEVYQNLGFERSQAGQSVGWRIGGKGDQFVSFGIHDIFDDNKVAFINGVENAILLDFNAQGPITI